MKTGDGNFTAIAIGPKRHGHEATKLHPGWEQYLTATGTKVLFAIEELWNQALVIQESSRNVSES